jgi:outer membrane autotransporter protein
VGADALVNPDWRAGLAFTYARSDLDSVGSSAASQMDVNTYQLVHYGSYALDARTDISYQLDVGLNQNKGKRFINLTSQQADSDYDSVNLHGGVGVSRQWQLGEASTVSPGVRMDYSRIRTQAYTETGAGNLNLNVGSDRQEELVLAAELRGVHALSANTRLDGFVSAGYNFSDRSATSTSAFVGGGTTFASTGLTSAPWLYRAGFGLLHNLGNLEYTARFDLEHRDSGFLNQTVSLRVRWAF